MCSISNAPSTAKETTDIEGCSTKLTLSVARETRDIVLRNEVINILRVFIRVCQLG
jgi:hypothetical protein